MDERSRLGAELDRLLGEDKFKSLGEELALVIAKHGLSKRPPVKPAIYKPKHVRQRGWVYGL